MFKVWEKSCDPPWASIEVHLENIGIEDKIKIMPYLCDFFSEKKLGMRRQSQH